MPSLLAFLSRAFPGASRPGKRRLQPGTFLLAVGLALGLVAAGPSAVAQTVPASPTAPAASAPAGPRARCDDRSLQLARERYEQANTLAPKKPEEALQELELAYRLCLQPVVLLGMGTVLEKLDRKPEAWQRYQEYLQAAPAGSGAGDARAASARLEVALAASHGRLKVGSLPPGALLQLEPDDGASRTTPWEGWLPPGAYALRLKLQGHEQAEQQVLLEPGKPREVAVTLEELPRDGEISVDAAEGAKVSVDGAPIGLAPLHGYQLRPGRHSIRVVREGFTPFETTRTITAGVHETIEAVLAPLPGTVSGSEPVRPVAEAAEEPRRWDLWAAGGLGLLAVGAGVAAIVLFGQAGDAEDAGSAEEETATTQTELDAAQDHYDEAAGLRTGGGISAGLGVAALAGTAWLLLRPTDEPGAGAGMGGASGPAAGVTFVPSAHGMGLLMQGAFRW